MDTKIQDDTNAPIKPRGTSVMLPHGGLPELFSPYLAGLIAKTGGPNGPIGLQFVSRPDEERKYFKQGLKDPLMEDEHEVAPGLVYKYKANLIDGGKEIPYYGRALWTITRHCAAYCRFCTRGREVGMLAGHIGESRATLAKVTHLPKEKIDETLRFIEQTDNLIEIILSGGDPLTLPPDILAYVMGKLGDLQKKGKLKIVRIGTRVPVHNPFILRDVHFQAVSQLTIPRVMVHINHPEELTSQTREVLRRFRTECAGVVMSQTVLLAGVNDSVATLYRLFMTLTEIGVVPYYVFQNDDVYWAKHFTVPIRRAISLWQKLRPRLSGVAATARFVIDVPGGYGKVTVPEGDSWEIDYDKGFRDFLGVQYKLDYTSNL